jgi:hypothetical protein
MVRILTVLRSYNLVSIIFVCFQTMNLKFTENGNPIYQIILQNLWMRPILCGSSNKFNCFEFHFSKNAATVYKIGSGVSVVCKFRISRSSKPSSSPLLCLKNYKHHITKRFIMAGATKLSFSRSRLEL